MNGRALPLSDPAREASRHSIRPHGDGFSLAQHTFGPFGPIRAKVQELAAASRTVKAGCLGIRHNFFGISRGCQFILFEALDLSRIAMRPLNTENTYVI
jgi:hypothetical protein